MSKHAVMEPIPRLFASTLAGLLAVLFLSNSVLIAPYLIIPIILAAVTVLTGRTTLESAAVAAGVWVLAMVTLLGPPSAPAVAHQGDMNLLAVARENFLRQWTPAAFAASWLVLALAVPALSKLKGQADRELNLGVVALLMVSCLFSGPNFDPPRLGNKVANPQPGYAFDGRLWMRIFYLTGEGTRFYEAFLQAFEEDARDIYPESLGKWRTPVLFNLWSLLLPPDGSALFLGFLLLSCAALGAAYAIAQQAGAGDFSVLAPILLYPYLLYAVFSLYFPFLEYWAALLILISLAVYLKGWRTLGLALGLLVFVSRELAVMYFAALTLDYLWQERTRARVWATAAAMWVLAALFYCAHRAAVIAVVGDHGTDLARVLDPGWFGSLWGCLRFGYLLVPWRPAAILLCSALGYAGCALASRGRVGLVAVAVMTTLFFMIFSHGGQVVEGRVVWLPDYWGTLLSPILLSLAPVALNWRPSHD